MAAARSIPDDLIHDILVRLPATAVLCFRAVCKQLRAIVDDHHRHRPPMPLLCLRRDDPPDHPTAPRHFRVRLQAIDLRACATQPVIRFTAPARRDHRKQVRRPGGVIGSDPGPLIRDEGDFQVHGSCGSVLLVSYKAGVYLCNPARRRWTKVPALNFDGIVGFYAHRPSGEFRMLHRSRRNTGSIEINYDYRILTLSPPRTFRRIIGGPHSDELLAAIRIRPASESPPALVAAHLHWLLHPDSSSDLLAFDPVSETFRRMRPPPAVDADGQAQALLELDGKLTMTLTRGDLATAELWVLQDYEREDSWACKLQIPLPPVADIVRDRPGAVVVVSLEGDVMVHTVPVAMRRQGESADASPAGAPSDRRRAAYVQRKPRSACFRQWSRDHNWVWGHSVSSSIDCNCHLLHSESSNTQIGGV